MKSITVQELISVLSGVDGSAELTLVTTQDGGRVHVSLFIKGSDIPIVILTQYPGEVHVYER